MNQLLQTLDLPLQLFDEHGFALVVPLKTLDMLGSGSDCRGFGATLEGVFCVLNVDPSGTLCFPAWNLGGEIIKLRLEFVAVAALDEIMRSPSRMAGSRRRNLAFGRGPARCLQLRWTPNGRRV